MKILNKTNGTYNFVKTYFSNSPYYNMLHSEFDNLEQEILRLKKQIQNREDRITNLQMELQSQQPNKEELTKLIAGNCHNDKSTKDAVEKIFNYFQSQQPKQRTPAPEELKKGMFEMGSKAIGKSLKQEEEEEFIPGYDDQGNCNNCGVNKHGAIG